MSDTAFIVSVLASVLALIVSLLTILTVRSTTAKIAILTWVVLPLIIVAFMGMLGIVVFGTTIEWTGEVRSD